MSHKRQLLRNMLKVAGDLALMAVKIHHKVFDGITIYGLLVNSITGHTNVLIAVMDFAVERSTVYMCEEPQHFSECIIRVWHKFLDDIGTVGTL